MLKAIALLPLFFLLSGCDTQKQDERISALEAKVKQLNAEVAELKQKPAAPQHHYELRSEGVRTFRFDPGTGETCVQLTSPGDWKRKETKAQSCDCIDAELRYLALTQQTDQQQKRAELFYERVKESCGE